MAEAPPIPVVCAVIARAGRVLVAQRPRDKHLPLKWEFPGGKVEPGEEPADAIIREIREELGCAVAVTHRFPSFNHDYGRVVIEMIPFVCAFVSESAEPIAHEHVALAWVQPEELDRYDLAPADWPVVEAFRRAEGGR